MSNILTLEIVHKFDLNEKDTHYAERFVRVFENVLSVQSQMEAMMSQVSKLTAAIAAEVQENKDAFASLKAAFAKQAETQSAQIADLKSRLEAGTVESPEVIEALGKIQSDLDSTNTDVIAAAALANTPAASSVPTDVATAAVEAAAEGSTETGTAEGTGTQ